MQWRGILVAKGFILLLFSFGKFKWAASWQNQQNDFAPSNDLDQLGHPPSLIRVFAVRMKKAWVLSYPLSAWQRLIRLGGCTGWSESSLGAHAASLVLSWGSTNVMFSEVLWWYTYTHLVYKEHNDQTSHVTRKPVFVVFDQGRFKLVCAATDTR